MPNRKKPTGTSKIATRITPSTEEMLIKAVRQSLREYGTIVPPKEALYAVQTKTCPHCDPEGKHPMPILSAFGLRKTKQGMRPQPWCRSCRNSKDSHPTRYTGS